MVSKKEKIGLLVNLRAKEGKEEDVRKFLLSGLGLVNEEVKTVSWFAFRIDERNFGIYDTFEVEFGRQAHLKGQVVKELLANAEDLFEDFEPTKSVRQLDVIATNHKVGTQRKGLLVMMEAQAGKSKDVEGFLNVGKGLVSDEPATLSWYAIKLGDTTYGIFDTFADDTGRDAHLNGAVAGALLDNAPNLLDGFEPSAIQKIDVIASK